MLSNHTADPGRLRDLARKHDQEMDRLGLRAMYVSWSTPADSLEHDIERRLELLRKLPSLLQPAPAAA